MKTLRTLLAALIVATLCGCGQDQAGQITRLEQRLGTVEKRLAEAEKRAVKAEKHIEMLQLCNDANTEILTSAMKSILFHAEALTKQSKSFTEQINSLSNMIDILREHIALIEKRLDRIRK